MSADGNRLQRARREILDANRDRPWFRPELIDAWDGVMGWDAARMALRAGDRRRAVRELARVARNPTGVRALLGELRVRQRARARSPSTGD
jgi:hypothetical protein